MQICREAGGRVMTNIMVRDLDLEHLQGPDGRRLEVVADGLPLFGGAQLALDMTLVSALKGDGTARRGAADVDGVALEAARKRKARTFPEPCGSPLTSPSGGDCPGSGRPVVDRDQEFLVPVGPSESPWRTPSHETTHGASVEVEVGFNVVVCNRKGSGHFIARVARGTRRDGETPTVADVEQESRYAG